MKTSKTIVPQLVLMVLAGCVAGDRSNVQQAQLESLRFDMPADWHRSDSARRGMHTSMWTPDENDHKESITIVRTETGTTNFDITTMVNLLDESQRSLLGASPPVIAPIVTAHGLSGARAELDYLPPEQHQPYHRVHAVLRDGSAMVHVLYTAKTPESGLDAFNTVLASIHDEVQP